MVAARLGAIVAAANADAAATGLRLCGMVDEPPRPSPDGSKASPTSVCIISDTSRAILPQVPADMANKDGASAVGPAYRGKSAPPCQERLGGGVPGRVGGGNSDSLRFSLRAGKAVVAE